MNQPGIRDQQLVEGFTQLLQRMMPGFPKMDQGMVVNPAVPGRDFMELGPPGAQLPPQDVMLPRQVADTRYEGGPTVPSGGASYIDQLMQTLQGPHGDLMLQSIMQGSGQGLHQGPNQQNMSEPYTIPKGQHFIRRRGDASDLPMDTQRGQILPGMSTEGMAIGTNPSTLQFLRRLMELMAGPGYSSGDAGTISEGRNYGGTDVSETHFGWADHNTPDKRPSNLYSGYKSNGQPDGVWWLAQIRKGVEYRKKCAFEGEWETWRKYYRGEYERGYLPVNVFFKMVRTLVPRVYFRNPSISISPSKSGEDNYALAQILERIDNKLLVKMKVKQAMKAMIQNAFMFGTGVGKLGYGAEFTPTPDFLDAAGPPGRGRLKHRVEFNDLVQPNMPWFLSVHTGSFIVPLGCTDIHSARWCAHWVKRHIDDVKEDPRLKHTIDLNVSTSYSSELVRTRERPREEGLVDLVEIRDKKSGKVFIMAPYYNQKILYCEDDEMMIDGNFPYFPLIFNADDTFFWGLPDSKILEPQQRELNETRTIMMKHRRASIIKLLYETGSLDPDEADKLTNESVAAAVRVNDGGLNRLKVIEAANIPQGLITMDALVERDVQEILGLGANQFGEYAPGSADRSATEASIVNQATQIRMDERRDAAADLLVDVVTQMHNVIFDRWSGEQVVDLVGPGGVQIWVRFRPEELQNGGYNVNVDPDSTLPETKAMKEAKAVQVYQLLKTNPLVDPHKLTSYLLKSFHGAQFDDMMISPQEAEMQKLAAMQGQVPGLTKDSAVTSKQYAGMLPQLRQIQGGKTPQSGNPGG